MKTDEKEEKKLPLGRTLYCNFLMLSKIWHMTPQYIVFMVLWENDGISVGELGRKLYLDNGTLTPLLKKMQDKGYLTRVRSKEDERVVIVTLTDEGWALREKVLSIPESVGSCVPLSEEEARTLYSLLYRVIDGMER